MYSVVRGSSPATGVEHSVACTFLRPGEKSLVVAGADVLKVFRLLPEGQQPQEKGDQPKLKLECLRSWKLFGWVQSMASVRLLGAERDSLLLAFKNAKLSLVEYNPENHDLKTLSLHHFEDDSMTGGYYHNEWVPTVRVDPEQRCAAMLCYGRKVVILPFRRPDSVAVAGLGEGAGLSLEGLELESSMAGEGSHVLPSYTLDLASAITSHSVDNIIDIQFLHGYNQPTLLLLYEPLATYPGRIAVRKDTCRLDVLSLDLKERLAAFIWSRELLPFDCIKAVPVPKPVGGCLVFAVNSLFYLNQGIPLYGVSLNSVGDKGVSTEVLVRRLETGVKLSLDCAVAEFLNHSQLVISLKGGELYVLSIIVDSLRAVKGFHLDKAAAGVLTTCISLPVEGYLFLGSRLGNSLLVSYTQRDSAGLGRAEREPPSKKKRLDMAGDWLEGELDEYEVYGSHEATQHHINTFSFGVCDSLLNIGPCGEVAMGEPAFLSEEFQAMAQPDPDIELVTTAGHGKNGALCLLQRSVRPQVVTTFQLPPAQDLWTVCGELGPETGETPYSAFLIISRADSSMVLQTGQEINELDSSGFFTSGPTVFACNLGQYTCDDDAATPMSFIVQVTCDSLLLLKESVLVQTLACDLGAPLTAASSADPHLCVLATNGEAAVYSLVGDKLVLSKIKIGEVPGRVKSPFLALSLYKDTSGLLSTGQGQVDGYRQRVGMAAMTGDGSSGANRQQVDDEDELLYGSSSLGSAPPAAGGGRALPPEPGPHLGSQPVPASYWLFSVRANGNLELYSLPDFNLRFVTRDFPLQHTVLRDNVSARVQGSSQTDASLGPGGQVGELLATGLGRQGSRLVLLARTRDMELLVYEAFPYTGRELTQDQLRLRFRKLNHGLILRERRAKSKKEQPPPSGVSRASLRYFRDIGGLEGVFLGGPYPHWLALTQRGELRTHPMSIDGSVHSLASFHNVNCPSGFLYFSRRSELRICVLPQHLSYDAAWPCRKVPLRCTPHYLTFHIESKTYALVTSVEEQTNKVWKFNGDDKELHIEDRSERFIYPTVKKFSLQLFSPVSWECVPGSTVQLEDWEHVTGMKHLYLSSEGMHSGQRGFIVLGTNFSYGEDITSRGHIKIYDVIEVVPEPGQPLTKHKVKTVYDKEQKGPVTALAAVSGFLVTTVGQKIYIWQLKDRDLHGIAFIDSQIYVHQIHTLKNFLLVADVYKSIQVLQYQQDYRTLSLISRDTYPQEVYASEFSIDNGHLGFVTTDSARNLSVFMYSPEVRESAGGQRLVRKADFHLGQHVTALWRVRARLTEPSNHQRLLTNNEKRHVTWFATLDGAIGHLLPVPEKTYRRLMMLMGVMNQNLAHLAGLNPKGFRTIRQHKKDLRNPSRGIVDGDLVFKYTDLTAPEKAEFARKIGTTPMEIMDDLAELDRNAAHF